MALVIFPPFLELANGATTTTTATDDDDDTTSDEVATTTTATDGDEATTTATRDEKVKERSADNKGPQSDRGGAPSKRRGGVPALYHSRAQPTLTTPTRPINNNI